MLDVKQQVATNTQVSKSQMTRNYISVTSTCPSLRRPTLAASFMRPGSLSRSWSEVPNAWHRGILERQWGQQKKAGTKWSKMVYQKPAKFATAAPVKDGGPGEDTQLLIATTSWGSRDQRGLDSRASDPALNLLNKLFAPTGTAVVLKD